MMGDGDAGMQGRRRLQDVLVVSMNSAENQLVGEDGRVFCEVHPNLWANAADASEGVAYLGTSRHGSMIVLRPLFAKDVRTWRNVQSSAAAPDVVAQDLAVYEQAVPAAAAYHEPEPRRTMKPNSLGLSDSEGPVNVIAQMGAAQRCEGLAAVCEATSWATSPSEVYQRTARAVADALMADQAHLHLLTRRGDRFKKCGRFVRDSAITEWGDDISFSIGRMQTLLKTSYPMAMDCVNPHPDDIFSPAILETGMKSAVSIPLLADGKVLGVCSVCYNVLTAWDDEAFSYLMCIARILGAVVQRMQSARKESELRILNERKQLGAELHDSASNYIAALSLASASVLDSYESGDDQAVRRGMERFEALSRESMRLMRADMMSLRTPLEQADGLVVGIEECLKTFEQSWGIKTSFSMGGEKPPAIPFEASLQLIRILDESLSNVIRHAHASTVHVSLSEEGGCLSMAVEDDGCGFDVGSVSPEKLGLRIMEERAQAANGRLTVVSSDEGTSVCVDIRKSR